MESAVRKNTDLNLRQAQYVKGLGNGLSRRQAAIDAGYSIHSANDASRAIEKPKVKQAFAKLMRQRIPAHKIAQRIAEGLDATETKFFAYEGRITDQAECTDWASRKQYAELAAKYGGYHEDAKESSSTAVAVEVKISYL